jgi:hypothetical protein
LIVIALQVDPLVAAVSPGPIDGQNSRSGYFSSGGAIPGWRRASESIGDPTLHRVVATFWDEVEMAGVRYLQILDSCAECAAA